MVTDSASLSAITQELSSPLWTDHRWQPREARADEADLRHGWRFHLDPPEVRSSLATAALDLDRFAAAGQVPDSGRYRIDARLDPNLAAEEHRLAVGPQACVVTAGGVEGIRRAVFWLEELMLAQQGPFLPLGEHHRSPVITTRISRCFFGPINRPPANRDELADDVNYYPDEYLNRLAHEGVNGLWLSVRLRDLVPQVWSGPVEVDPQRRLTKLRRTVNACARYGIRIFLFCIDPAAFGDGAEYLVPPEGLVSSPELGGHRDEGWTALCANGPAGKAYLEESLRHVFSEVPGLGGLVNITMGERPTHCWSAPWSGLPVNCPRCGPAGPAAAMADLLTTLRNGVHAGNPNAEVISWMYVPYIPDNPHWHEADVHRLLVDVAARTPAGVTVQVNMESTGRTSQLGRDRPILDYSLAWVGPSEVFSRVAEAVSGTDGAMGAKLQVGCSHEVATVPYVPVPGNLYRKYRALHDHGVSTVMQCWYFGNAPGPMTRAAGRLAFAPLPADETEFLTELAAPDWGPDTPTVVQAWDRFRTAYEQFPAHLPFSWYGPVHNSIMWPWHLEPVDKLIAPSWQLGWPPSGDRVGECFAPAFSFDEIVDLVTDIAQQWESGWSLLAPLAAHHLDDRSRILDLGVAEALALQWASAARTLEFYRVREQLARCPVTERESLLDELGQLVRAEITATARLADLAEVDARLGFHSEAEGHQYHPAGLRERGVGLQSLLDTDLPELRARCPEPDTLWPGWVSPTSGDLVAELGTDSASSPWHPTGAGRWRAWISDSELHLEAVLPVTATEPRSDRITILIEPRRLWPVLPFRVNRAGEAWTERTILPESSPWTGSTEVDGANWRSTLTWQLDMFNAPTMTSGFRINVIQDTPHGEAPWTNRSDPLRRRRNCFANWNPADLGWVTTAH